MLRELIKQLVLEAIVDQNDILLEYNDLNSILIKNRNKEIYNIKGLEVYCAFTHIGNWSLCKNQEIADLLQYQAKADTFEVSDVIKKDIDLESGYRLTMMSEDRTSWRKLIAVEIANYFKDKNIISVTYADSSSEMPREIAELTAKFLNVNCNQVFKKNRDPKKLNIVQDKVQKYLSKPNKDGTPKTKDQEIKFRRQLQRNLDTLRGHLEYRTLSIAGDFDPKTREYFSGIHDINNDIIKNLKGNVLLIDDNIDSGSTFIDIDNQIKQNYPDINLMFAVGFRINRGSKKEVEKKEPTEQEKKKQKITRILNKEKTDDTENELPEKIRFDRYNKNLINIEQKDIIEFSLFKPYNYKVGDVIKSDKLGGIGFIEEVDERNSTITVNFELGIKKLKYTPESKSQIKEKKYLNEIYFKVLKRIKNEFKLRRSN